VKYGNWPDMINSSLTENGPAPFSPGRMPPALPADNLHSHG
jgi:hypothetical protein